MRSLLLHINKYTGISEAYGRAIGTNFGFSSIAQSPPPEPELPLPQRRSGALAREGGKRAKLAKPTLRTSGSPVRFGIVNAEREPASANLSKHFAMVFTKSCGGLTARCS